MLKEYGRSGTAVEVQALGFPQWFIEQDVHPNDLIHLKVMTAAVFFCLCDALTGFTGGLGGRGLVSLVSLIIPPSFETIACLTSHSYGACIQINTCIFMYLYACVCVCVCMYACMHACMYIYENESRDMFSYHEGR